jgi:hypothetical protein
VGKEITCGFGSQEFGKILGEYHRTAKGKRTIFNN